MKSQRTAVLLGVAEIRSGLGDVIMVFPFWFSCVFLVSFDVFFFFAFACVFLYLLVLPKDLELASFLAAGCCLLAMRPKAPVNKQHLQLFKLFFAIKGAGQPLLHSSK